MQQSYRGNLTSAEFPLLSELQGRNVIIMGPDQNYSRQANSPKNKDRDIGIPQPYYMHNVMPTEAGLTSVAYRQITGSAIGGDSTFDEMLVVRDPTELVAYFANTKSGKCFVLIDPVVGWIRTTDKVPAAGRLVTVAHVNGQSYICFGGTGVFKYNFGTNTLDAVTLAGTTASALMGVCASNGYMIAWTDNSVIWSSLIDPTDFVPSLITSAGGGGVQNVKAAITVVLPQNTGFVVYTKRNSVAGFYTNNAQYPFTYKEIIGAGGVATSALVAYDGNSTNHTAYTTAGLQEISLNNSAVVYPAVTDFIAGSQFEDFDETTLTFTQTLLAGTMMKKLTIVANRYTIISYGINALTHAIVIDMALARWGKLKITHVDCFEYFVASSAITEIPKQSIGFLLPDGTVQVMISSYATTGAYGTVLLGKYQLDRDHYLNLQEIHLETVRTDSLLKVSVLSAIDGLNTSVSTPQLITSTGSYRRFHCKPAALNHSVVVTGAFNLNCIVLKYSEGGMVR